MQYDYKGSLRRSTDMLSKLEQGLEKSELSEKYKEFISIRLPEIEVAIKGLYNQSPIEKV